ncbi:MAG: flagellar filament capping protein FliD [Acidimicrobiales bacterium]
MTSVDGLTTGLDTTSIINQLMAIERQPITRLETRQNQERAAKTELTGIRSDINNIKTLASDLRLPTGWNKVAATSTNEEAITLDPGSGDFAGQFSFTVTELATPKAIYSATRFDSLDSVVTDGGAVFSGTAAQGLGISSMAASGFGGDAVSFEVVQASEPATVEGLNIPIIPITVDATNDAVDFEVDGFSYSVTLTHQTYDTEQALADALNAAIAGDPAASDAARAYLTDDNKIAIASIAEGSDHSLATISGSALPVLGLSAGAGATGVDAVIEVNGSTTAISDVQEGATATIYSGTGGEISATLSGSVTAGTADVQSAGFGGGSLREVVDTINSTDGIGYTAAAINTGSGYILSLTATESGADSEIDLDLGTFGAYTSFNTLSEGTDAVLTVEGDEPYTVTSSSNEFNELLPGVGITVNQVTTEPVTVTVAPDDEQLADQVGELVEKLNSFFARASTATDSDPVSGTRAVLQGNASVRRAEGALRQALVDPVDDSSLTSAGMIGIELDRDGNLNFDRDRFLETIGEDREALTRLFAAPGDEGAEPGILDRIVDSATQAAAVSDGYITSAAEAADRQIDDYNDQIEAYERRLELRETALRRTYANLEVVLGGLQQQSSYLSSQLAGLGGTS